MAKRRQLWVLLVGWWAQQGCGGAALRPRPGPALRLQVQRQARTEAGRRIMPVAAGGAQAPLAASMLARAFDAVLRTGQDAYLLPGMAFLARGPGGEIFRSYAGVRALPLAGEGALVDTQTRFAVAWPRHAASCPATAPHPPAAAAGGRAQGHVVDLQRGWVQPVPAAGGAAASEAARYTIEDWSCALAAGLDACHLAQQRRPMWPDGAVGVPGFSAYGGVLCDQQVAYMWLVNAAPNVGSEAVALQLRATAKAYAPSKIKPRAGCDGPP